MNNSRTLAVMIIATVFSAPGAIAQLPNPEISDSGSGLVLSLSADGNCWDDCWVQSIPLGQGTTIAIMKGAQVLDQGFVAAPLDVSSDAPTPPPGGTGSVSVSFHAPGVNDAGETGIYVTTIVYTYSNFIIRDADSDTRFVKDLDPLPGEGEDG